MNQKNTLLFYNIIMWEFFLKLKGVSTHGNQETEDCTNQIKNKQDLILY